jgi:chromosomal replication initiator protein
MIDYQPEHSVGIQDVVREVAAFFKVSPREILGPDRHRQIARARHVACYLCRRLPVAPSYPALGRAIGDRDHTTVMASVQKIQAALSFDRRLAEQIESIQKRLAALGGTEARRSPRGGVGA